MTRLVAAEFTKLYTTRLWSWLLLAAMALTALYASLTVAFGDAPGSFAAPLSSVDGQRTLLSVGAAAAPFAAVLGAIGIAGEYRHRTATGTFVAAPRRWDVIVAKLAVHATTGAGYGIVCSALAFAIGRPWLEADDIPYVVGTGDLMATLAGDVVAVALFAAIGVGVGALLTDQVAAVVTLLVYLLVVENVLTHVPALDDWTPYLPGQAEEAVVGSTLTDRHLVTPWQGGLLLAGYAFVVATAGIAVTKRRDIT